MNDSARQQGLAGRSTALFLTCVIGVAIVGYFVGINDGFPHQDVAPVAETLVAETLVAETLVAETPVAETPVAETPVAETPVTTRSSHAEPTPANSVVIPAASYSEMRRSESGPTSRWQPMLDQIPQPEYDLFAEIKPALADKQRSMLTRASRRAFNGAPR